MKRVNNPISYELEKAGMAVRRLADLLGAQYRTVEDWNARKSGPLQDPRVTSGSPEPELY